MRENIRIQKPSVNALLLGIYLFIVWSIYLFINFYEGISTITRFSGLLLLCAVMVFFVSRGLISFVSKISCIQGAALTPKRMILSYCIFFLISFGILFFWYLAYYPGAFSFDSIGQLEQAISGNYNDWHPVWHTLLFFTLPLSVTGKMASIILFQIIYFSLILGYLAISIYQLANLKYAVISLGYILLNPYTGCVAMYPWKDLAMAATILWSMVCVAKIYCTNGQWGLNRGRVMLLAVLLANATLFRHNAVLFTVPMVIALFFQLERKKWLELLILFITFIFIVKVPVYSALEVEKPGRRLLETMGLPLTIIANVTKENPEMLDEKTAGFVYRMATQEEWEEKYICGNFNSIKAKGIDTSVVDESNMTDILGMTLRCFKVAPLASSKALFMLTDMVYSIEGPIEGDVSPDIIENDLGIVYKGNELLKSFLLWYKQAVANTIFKYIQYIGVSILVMLVVILSKSDLRKSDDWKRILVCAPVFFYNFGTMLLLTGPDSRFFYVSYLVCPMVILIMLRNKEENLQ